MSRVLSSEQAKSSIKNIQGIIDGGLTNEISHLDKEGQILCDPNVWDGPHAENFRNNTWPETRTALNNCLRELGDLRQQLDTISQNIFTAGGS